MNKIPMYIGADGKMVNNPPAKVSVKNESLELYNEERRRLKSLADSLGLSRKQLKKQYKKATKFLRDAGYKV